LPELLEGGLLDRLERRLGVGEVDCDRLRGDNDLDCLLAGEMGERLAIGGEMGEWERRRSLGDLERDLLDLELYSFFSTGEEGDGDLLRVLEGLLEKRLVLEDSCWLEDFFLEEREMSE